MAATPRMAVAPSGEACGGRPSPGAGDVLGPAGGTAARSPAPRWHSYPGRPDQAARARALIAGLVDGCPAAADVVLMAGELASNAIQHSRSGEPGGTFRVRVAVRPGTSVRVEVADAGGPVGGPGRRAIPRSREAAACEVV